MPLIKPRTRRLALGGRHNRQLEGAAGVLKGHLLVGHERSSGNGDACAHRRNGPRHAVGEPGGQLQRYPLVLIRHHVGSAGGPRTPSAHFAVTANPAPGANVVTFGGIALRVSIWAQAGQAT